MRITKVIDSSKRILPIIASLPYSIIYEDDDINEEGVYDPELQLTHYVNAWDTTCIYDETIVTNANSYPDTSPDD